MLTQLFKETGRIFSLLFRQHRLNIFLWLVGIVGLTISVAYVYPMIYENQSDLVGLGITMQNPAMTAMLGPAQSPSDYTAAIAFAGEMLLFTAIGMAVMNILLVSTTTRLDEEEGRLELVQSLPVGKLSYTTASTLLMLILNGVITIVIAVGLGVMDNADFTWEASLLYGAVLGSTGLFFSGATIVAAQLSETTRGTRGIAFTVLILSYLIRAVGDVSNETLSLFSPLGWTVRTEVFATNEWWPIIGLAVGSVILIGVGFILNRRRDIFQGLLPQRPGRKNASWFLKTLPGFVWSQEKVKLISWALGIFLIAAAFGAILGDLETYFADMDILQAFLPNLDTATLTEEFTRLLFAIMSLFTGIPAVTMITSLKHEEDIGRLENIYSRSVSRTKLLLTYYCIGLVFIAIMQLLMAIGIYYPASLVMDEPLSLVTFVEMALLYVPSIWFLLSLATFILGFMPKVMQLIWLYLTFSFIVSYLGELMEFPEWLNNLSVFYHTPVEFDGFPLLVIIVVAIVLSALGFIGYNRRDLKN